MATLKPGDRAPDFALQDQEGRTVRLSDYRGRKLLLYFYPKADTPGCTTQACSIRDSGDRLRDASIAAVGISPDQPSAQKRFDQKYALGFPLLSDESHAVAEAYGDLGGEDLQRQDRAWGSSAPRSSSTRRGRMREAWYKVRPEDTVPNAVGASRH